ncbi:carotenoid biosynthesis protein [Lacrimispora sp.]|uniref:carotenoid biosynthesis protein n=1 Tax=Lacrimispora sp. TaxID=2719234 RepID=UPI0032E4DCFB
MSKIHNLSTDAIEKRKSRILTVMWVLLAVDAIIFAIMGLTDGEFGGVLAPFLGVSMLLAFVLLHGFHRYGFKTMLIFFLITFIVSWSYESLSVHTGFPFGHYHYTDLMGVKLGVVPVFIMPTYFAVAYLSWSIAQVLLDQQQSRLSGASVFIIPFFSAFNMVLWDLCFDPFASTIKETWIWENGGGYFGVPIENFLGWFLCTYTIFQLFALYLRFRYYKNSGEKNEQTQSLWLMPCIMYGALSLQHLLVIFSGSIAQITAQDNHIWMGGDIREALTTVCLFTMVYISSLSATKVLGNKGVLNS